MLSSRSLSTSVAVLAFLVLTSGSLFAAPTINSVSPTSGIVGTSVTINGSGFGTTQGSSTVKFNGTAGTPTSWTSTQIVVPVPSAATSGTIVVKVGSASSGGAAFNVIPHITTLSPSSGSIGTSVTISGSGFGATKGTSTVTFNGTTATPTSWGVSSIVVPVPSGATTGMVRVTVGGIAGNDVLFIVGNGPGIASISPTSGPAGTSVTITGGNFGSTQGSSTVTFGGIAASVSNWASTSITATVPSGVLAGNAAVAVTVNNIASNSFTFNDTNTVINSLSINSAPENQPITINGANFGASQGTNSSVTFNGTVGVPSSWSDTAITVPVPTGATTGNIVVTANSIASIGYAFMVVPASQPPGVRFIQGNYAIAGSVPSSIAVPFPIGQTAGDLNVVVVGWQGAYHVTSVVDTAGNTYSLAVGPTVGTTRRQSIYYAKNISSATTNTVTVSFASTCCGPVLPLAVDVRMGEYSGLNTTAPLDVVAGSTATGTTADSGFVTTTSQNDLLVGAGVADSVINAAGSNYTSRVRPVNNGANNSDILEDRIVTATGSYDATAPLSASAAWVMQMVAFKEAANQAPVVNAGSNQTITLPTNTATLHGTATDDGLPNNTLTISWTQVSGPGTASFNTPNQAITDATFTVAGTYVLQLTANDSQLSSSSNVTVTVNPNQPPIVNAGANQTITWPQNSVALNGSVSGNNILTTTWSSTSGPSAAQFVNSNNAVTNAVFGQAGVYVLTLSASNPAGSASSSVTITVNPPTGTPAATTLTLSPRTAGPVSIGVQQQFQATLLDGSGTAIANTTVTFSATGANVTAGQATTNSAGVAPFSYVGSNIGVDTAIVTARVGAFTVTSAPTTVSWVSSAPQVTSSPVIGNFFASDGSGTFNTLPSAQPVFSQTFSAIDFNPPAGSVPGTPNTIDVTTRPFTDVATDVSGHYSSSVIAQGNNVQAGVGQLSAFQAVFTGTFTVAAAGNVTFTFFSSDGFVFGVGNSATRVSGTSVRSPVSTSFNGYPVMGAFNNVTAPTSSSITVHFPAGGSYPYEVDYAASNQIPLVSPSSGWRYSLNNQPGFQQLGFDDSSWLIGDAPFTNAVGGPTGCSVLGNTLFPINGVLDVRKTVNLPAGASGISASTAVDSGFTLWVNGTMVSSQNRTGCPSYWDFTVPVPDNVWLPGENLVTLQATNADTVSGFDFELTGPSSSLPSIPKQLSLTMKALSSSGTGGVTLSPTGAPSPLGLVGLCGAFTDNTGKVIEPLSIGAAPVGFAVPAGATQLQLGVNDDKYSDNGGGFVVKVNGVSVNVPPAAMPWNWVAGGLNTAYQYGIKDGTAPVVALAGLIPGQGVTIAYNSGTVSAGFIFPFVNADGYSVTGSGGGSTGTFFPTRYMTPLNSTVGQLITFTALVTDSSGSPVPNAQVTLNITGPNAQQLQGTTDSTGIAAFTYRGVSAGTDILQAQAFPSGSTSLISNQSTITWNAFTNPPATGSLVITPTNPPNNSTGQAQTFTVQALDGTGNPAPNVPVVLMVSLANAQQLTATTNSSGIATFSYVGNYTGADNIQAEAIISSGAQFSSVVSVTWTLPGGGGGTGSGSCGCITQGWIGWPTSGSTLQAQTPITVASGVSLSSGTLTFWPTSNPSAVTTLSSNTTGSGTLGTFDPTALANGGYTIQLSATANGTTQISQISINVVGENKPGRMKSTVTEFKVPLAGIPISITRTYDSLDRSKIEDFGYGWKLGSFVDLSVDNKKNVTFNFNGQKITFYFTPQPVWLLGTWLTPNYTPQAGLHGSLASDGCGGLLNLQGTIVCFPNTGQSYQPTLYAYTDPVGRTYTMTATGQLISIKDLNGNTLTFTPNGITSSVGGTVVAFNRDGTGRITSISDTNQPPNVYQYAYDASGNLASVTYPGISTPETYVYDTPAQDCPTSPSTCIHLLKSETDPRGNSSSATYYTDGRLQGVTGPSVPDPSGNGGTVHFTTQYAYNLSTNTTTITNPDGGTVTRTDDSFGNPLTVVEKIDASTNRTTTYQYDSKENLTQVTDPLNHITHYTYDANGFQTSVQLQGLPADSKTYNQFGGITSQNDAANTNTITTTYDSNFNPAQITDKLNGTGGSPVATYSNYDAMGNFADSTDANGKATHYDYYQTGPSTGYLQDVIRTNGAVQEKTSYTYDLMGKVLTVTDACGNGSCPDVTVGTSHTTTYTYDQLERVSTMTDAAGIVTKYVYDNNGNKTDQYDAFGTGLQRHTVYQYDNLNRLTQTTYPDLTTKQFVNDFRGNKTVETDPLGHKTVYVYDFAGQQTSVTQASGTADAGTVSYTYYLDGRQNTIKDETNQSTGLHTTNTYDPAGRLISVQDALSNLTSYGYDADGRRTSVTEPNNQGAQLTTTYAYDPRGRLKTITYPPTQTQLATSMQYTYDGMGRVTSSIDQNNTPTNKTYDDVGRLTSVTDAIPPNGNVTTYAYDLNGNLKTLTDANLHLTQYQYDTMNRRAKRTLPLGQHEDYTYDALGRLKTKLDFNQTTTTTYNYDTMDRLLSKVPSSGTGISFTYTATGQRQQMTYGTEVTNYTQYDNRDRLLTKNTLEGILNYTYDAHGNVLTINSSNANGASLTYTYDALNRLASAKDNRVAAQGGSANPTTYSYDATGNLLGYAYPNTVKTSNLFDPLNRLTQTCSATSTPACSAGTKLSSYTYGLAPAGNRLTVAELNTRQVIYGYDNDYRLTSEAISSDPAGNNGTVNYTQYDPVGNRQTMTSSLNAVPGGSFSYDANDRLSVDTYDANGNTTSSAGITNLYDFENRMTQHGTSPGVLLTYDGDGNRVSETATGTTTKFLVDDKNPTGLPQVLDELVSGAVTRTYAYGLQRISENQQIGGNWTPSFYGYDGHANVRFLASSAGAITDSYDDDAFGMPIKTNGNTANTFLFSGERYDSSIGLYDLRARYYNQATGRLWARDSVEGIESFPLSFHPYVYASDNPVNLVDPTGKNTVALPSPSRPVVGGALGEYIATVAIAVAAVASVAALGCTYNAETEIDARRVANDAEITRTGCGAKGKGRMRIQLQAGTNVTVPGTPVLIRDDPPGVTKADAYAGLLQLWGLAQGGQSGFPFNANQSGLRSAIISVSVCVKRQTGTAPGIYTVCQAYVTGNTAGWRIDLENLNGINLRQ